MIGCLVGMPERWAKKKDGQKMGTKKCPHFLFLKENGQRKKKGGQKMGHQIGKDGISLKSKMNVLKSMVPSSSSVYISQLIKYPTVGCPPAPTPHP